MNLQLENFGSVDSLALFSLPTDVEEFLRTEQGNVYIESFSVFRTGTFKDSMGEQHSWSTEHLAQMVSNFKILSESGKLQGVPVRDGHKSYFDNAPGSGVGRVVGWVTDLRLGGKNVNDEQMLVADFEFTEEDAAEKFRTGTFRARSSEIGMYETNDESMHWPTFLGFAFVDIAAVENLFSKANTSSNIRLSHDTEGTMTVKPKTPAEIEAEAAAAAVAAAELAATNAAEVAAAETAAAEAAVAEAAETAAAAALALHGSASGTFSFQVGGSPTTDFAAVQRHIDTLEGLSADYVTATRNDYVTGLGEKGVVAATKIEEMKLFARGMSPEQYTQFTAMYDDAPANALFAIHAGGVTNTKGESGTNSDPSTPNELETLTEKVEYARKSGLGQADLEKLDSFKRLQQLKNAAGSN